MVAKGPQSYGGPLTSILAQSILRIHERFLIFDYSSIGIRD